MAATVGNTTVGATPATTIFNKSSGCTSLLVRCPSTSAVSLLVHVDGLHDTDEWATIEIGTEYIFRNKDMGIVNVQAKGNAGTASIIWFIVAKT